MTSYERHNTKFAMEHLWYEEYIMFLMPPACATLACYFMPLFHNEEGLTSMAILPLSMACSYGQSLSLRKSYYERKWKKIMDYPAFILATVKSALLFAIPAGIVGWITSLFLNGYQKELATFFEISVWGLASGICLCAFYTYSEETLKLRKTNSNEYSEKLTNVCKWIFPPCCNIHMVGFF